MVDQRQWNSFVTTAPGGSFLQSWEWGEIQAKLGVPYWRLVDETAGEVTGAALVIKRELPWGKSWLYVPKGPLLVNPKSKIQNPKLFQQIIALAEKEGAMFIRIEPATEPGLPAGLAGEDWRKAANDVQPRHTLLVDITKPEDTLLSEMHQKTRYNIHVAAKHGVAVRFSSDPKDLEHFLRLSREVSGRTAFSFHPDDYYKAMLTTGIAELALAEHEGDVLAAHLLVSFGDTVTYVHGASGSVKRKVMAPHLLQWESMKRAKAAGYKYYDFFGVAPENADDTHPWSGITKFKVGFGGQRVSYAGAYDYVLDPVWYWSYSTSRRARSLWR